MSLSSLANVLLIMHAEGIQLMPVACGCHDSSRVLSQEDPDLTADWKPTINIAVTGAGGQISNHLLFMMQNEIAHHAALMSARRTQALIALTNAPSLPPRNFHALTRLDENRARCSCRLPVGEIAVPSSRGMPVWMPANYAVR